MLTIEQLLFKKPISISTRPQFDWFDKDGFGLTEFESRYYRTAGFVCDKISDHTTCFEPLSIKLDNPRVRVDHAYVCSRVGFTGSAQKQIHKLIKQYNMPELIKAIQIRPKIGVDISLEYMLDDEQILDLFHYEYDFITGPIDEAEAKIDSLRATIETTDWNQFAQTLISNHNQWIDMTGDDQNDYRAKLLGLDRAYTTHKVI